MSFPFQSGQLTLASNLNQLYQSTSKYDTNVNFGGSVSSADSNSIGIHDTALLESGLYEHWRKYSSWNNTGGSVTSNSNLFTPTTTGVTVLKRGYYRCAMNLHFQSSDANVAIAARFAQNNVINGPVGLSGRTASSVDAASLSLNWTFFLRRDFDVHL